MDADRVPLVDDLVARLGHELVSVAVAPADPAATFDAVVVYDPLDAPEFEAGALVLAVGVSASSAFALQLAAARPAALVLRHEGPVGQPLVAEALAARVALLLVPPTCSWASVHSIASSLPTQAPPILAESVMGTEVISDLFAVANALAATLGAPITIEDNQSRLLAYSALQGDVDVARAATILGHRVPDSFRHEVRRLGVAKRMLTETEPFFLESSVPDITSRTVVTLRERDEILGSIWAVTDQPLDALRTAALAEAARSIAVRLAHHRLTTNLQRQHQIATMCLLLRGGATAVEAGRRAGLDGTDFRLAAITATKPGGEKDDLLLARCESAVAQQLALIRTAGANARVDDTLYAVVPGSADPVESLAAVRTLLLTARAAARPELPHLATIAISSPFSSLADLSQAREETDRVLEVLSRSRGHDGCAEVGDVGLAVSMLRLADLESARRAGRRNVLDDVADYDEAHGTSYGHTLRVYLSSFGDPSAASQTLGVHTNTLRYRLRRLDELFGLDLNDGDVRFAMMVEIRLRALASRAS